MASEKTPTVSFSTDTEAPFDIQEFIQEQLLPEVTEHQITRNKCLQSASSTNNFQNFMHDAYSWVLDLFETFKIPPKKFKCNWCIMCSRLHSYFEGNMYERKCKLAFNCEHLSSAQRCISCQMYFALLAKIIKLEKDKLYEVRQIDSTSTIQDMSDLERSILRYIAGATIYEVTESVCESAINHMLTSINKSRIEYRCCQLLKKLCLPEGYALEHTNDPEYLKEILECQYKSRGLTVISDEAFTFFKLLYCKVKSVQTFQNLERNKYNLLHVTELDLKSDLDLIDVCCSLFNQTSEQCECETPISSECESSDEDQVLQYKLEQSMVLEMFDKVLHYFCTVHLSDIVAKYKDIVLCKTPQVSIHHQIISGMKLKVQRDSAPKYLCGNCLKECIDVESVKDPQFEDFSVCCDKCDKLFHYICLNLTGNEPELQEGSTVPFFCANCQSTGLNPKSGKGKGKGKQSKSSRSTVSFNTESASAATPASESNLGLQRSGCIPKPVKWSDFV